MMASVCGAVAFQLTAPLREPTACQFFRKDAVKRFNSRLPCGSRRSPFDIEHVGLWFQLTAPLREPTFFHGAPFPIKTFQLTAPLREPTLIIDIRGHKQRFQLTAPLREPT